MSTAVRLGGDRACALPAVARGGVRALLPARRTEVLLAPVSGCGGAAPFLVAPAGEEAQALRMEPLRREILPELVGDPETLLIDSTLLEVLHPRQVSHSAGWGNLSAGAAWVRWGSFSVYGVKLHLLLATNRVPISYELTPANVADVSLTEELLDEAKLGEEVARRVLGDLAYRSEELREVLAKVGIILATEPSKRRRGVRQHIEIAFSSLKRVFGLGETLATTLVGLATRIAAKICAYTYAFLVNRHLDRPQGRIKELWA
jgi:Transposase DDE domain